MHPQYSQQGYGPQQPYDEPGPVRASAGASAIAGILGLLAAGAMIWVVVEYFTSFQGDVGRWQSEAWIVVIVRAMLALLLLVLAGLTLARRVAAAWTLLVVALLTAATVLLEPLVFGQDIGSWFEQLFEFGASVFIGMVAAGGLGLLAAIMAIFAGAIKSGGQQPQYPGYPGGQQYPGHSGGQQYPGHSGGQQYPRHSGGQQYPRHSGGQQRPRGY